MHARTADRTTILIVILVATLVLGVAFWAAPDAGASGSHGQTWSFTQSGVVAKFRGYHYNSAYDQPGAWTTNIDTTCYEAVRLTHSQAQLGWYYGYPTAYSAMGPVGAVTVSSLHRGWHCLNDATATYTLN
ncbi:MAG: hypothetical protein WEA29_07085 [Acidimicrobiia bacterium]